MDMKSTGVVPKRKPAHWMFHPESATSGRRPLPALNVRRFPQSPIITPDMDGRMGNNINGPSLIRVPEWVSNPMGRYYLYFAHHEGTFIRLAYANQLEGPWNIHSPGVLDVCRAFFNSHIASPDVHVCHDTREIRMYYHGCCLPEPPHQFTRLAVSSDGISFTALPEILGTSYWRAFKFRGYWHTLEMPGTFRRSACGTQAFEKGPRLFSPTMRHSAVHLSEDILTVFYSEAGDSPERILWATIDLIPDWSRWQIVKKGTLLAPAMEYEGADCPVVPSRRGSVHQRVRQLRDPCVFEENERLYLLYSVAGESGIAIAELEKI